MSALPWLTFLARFGLSVALIVVIQMNARRVGGAVWFLAALPAVHIVMSLAFKVASWTTLENPRAVFGALRMLDVGLTTIAALFVVIGCALLRTPLRR